MQVALFKALKSINIDDQIATAVVDKLEEHLEHMIKDATKPGHHPRAIMSVRSEKPQLSKIS